MGAQCGKDEQGLFVLLNVGARTVGAQYGKDEQGFFVLLNVGARIVGAQCGSPIWAPYGDMGSAGAHEPIPHAAALFSTLPGHRFAIHH